MCSLNKKGCKKLDLKKRFHYKKNQYLILAVNTLIQSKFIRTTFTAKKLRILLISNKVKVKNHCVISRRSSAVISKFRLSRLKFRYYASNGFLVGIKKSV